MTTSVYSLASDMDVRLAEMRGLVSRAEKAFDTDEKLYDLLCRAGSVLLVSALEGFIKDVNVAIQTDLNLNVASFSAMPRRMQKEFTDKIAYYDSVPEVEMQKRSAQLSRFFNLNSVNIDMGAFPYKENVNKNPSANVIDIAFHKYGIQSVMHCLAGSRFEVVFDNDNVTDFLLRREIKRMRATLFRFPYRSLPKAFEMTDWVPSKGQVVPVSLWHTFLENILGRRHAVVHADTRGNPTSWQALNDDINKMDIMFNALLLAVASLLGADL